MKKLSLSLFVIFVFGLCGLSEWYFSSQSQMSLPPIVSTTLPSTSTGSSVPVQTPVTKNTPPAPVTKKSPQTVTPPPPKKLGPYNDGTYTGSVANAYYGNVQVRATILNGQITDVTFLQYPNDRSTSRYINSQAMPYLIQEAIQTQNANVNAVSGASDTSAAFKQSLAAALAQAA